MPRKSKPHSSSTRDVSKDLWISPRSNLKGPNENQGNITPSSGSRFLELADIALGLKKAAPRKKRAASEREPAEKLRIVSE